MIFRFLKKVIFAFFIIYTFDLLFNHFNIIVPLNFANVATVSILGFPGLIVLALSFKFLL